MLNTLSRNSENKYNEDEKEEEKERKKGSYNLRQVRRESWQALLRFSFLSLRYLYASHRFVLTDIS